MKVSGSSIPVDFPPALLAELEATAEAEHRTAADIVRDLVERGLRDRRRAQELNRRTVRKVSDMSPDELAVIARSEMDPRYNYLDDELR